MYACRCLVLEVPQLQVNSSKQKTVKQKNGIRFFVVYLSFFCIPNTCHCFF